MEISKMLKEKRKEYQLTQEQLAKKISVSTKTVSNWENKRTIPDIQYIILLAKLFNVSLDYLLLEGSDMVESINNDIKKGRGLIKIIMLIIISIVFIFSMIFFVHYQNTKVYREQYKEHIINQPKPSFKTNSKD